MNRGIYTTATGMAALEKWMDITANNLANVNTVGFKKDGIAFDDLLRRQMFGEGGSGPIVGVLGSGAAPFEQFTDLTSGGMQMTGNSLDFALTGNQAMFAVQTPNGIRFTRNGAFTITPTNGANVALTTKTGEPVLDANGQPITFGKGTIQVDREGNIALDGTDLGTQIGVFRGMFTKSSSGNQFFEGQGVALAPKSNFGLIQGSLEESNVNTIEAMVAMIAMQRSYEMSQKSIQSQDEETSKLIGTLS